MADRHEAFGPMPVRRSTDPHPDEITAEEGTLIEKRLDSGTTVPARLVRKMLHVVRRQRNRIEYLEGKFGGPRCECCGNLCVDLARDERGLCPDCSAMEAAQ